MRVKQVGLCTTFVRGHTALIQLVGVVVCIVPLIFPTYVPVWAIPGSLAVLALLLGIGLLLAGRAVVRTAVDIPILVLLLLLPINLLITPDRSLTLPHVYKMVGSVALFYGVVGVLNEQSWFGLGALAISLLGVVLAVIVLLGTQQPIGKLPWLPVDRYQLSPRLLRPFWNPKGFNANIAGGALAMLLPVPVAYLFFGRRPLVRLGALLGTVVLTLVLVFTQSRGAMVALGAGVAVMLVARSRRWLIMLVLLAVVGVLALQFVGLDSLLASVSYTTAESAVNSVQGRRELWSRGWKMLGNFPFTGVGFGMVVKVMPWLYPTFLIPNDAPAEHVHNLYLDLGAQMGVPGLIATLAFLLGLFYHSWLAAQRARGSGLEPLGLGTVGVVGVFSVHGLFDDITFYAKAHFIAWALFGLAAAVWLRLAQDGEPSDADTPSG